MKKSAITCAVLAASLGFSTLASAQDWRGRHDGGQRTEQRHDRNWSHDGYRQVAPAYTHNQPRYVYNQPRYVYSTPQYYGHAHRFYRGGYLPRQYFASSYYVNDWRAYPGLYAPPYGYQWVDTGGEFVLAAIATGLIANLLMH
jgi:Ni/Co efflux regulator RcnB